LEKVKEQVLLNESLITLNLNTVSTLLLEYVVFFDMKKMQDIADKDFGGDLKALTKFYKVSAYKFFSDKIEFQTTALTSKSAQLNKLMLDFDGEFATGKTAKQATPDADGTMAPLGVRGKGLTILPASQAHSQPTTPVKTPPLTPTPVVPTTEATPIIPNGKSFFIGINTILAKFKEETADKYIFTANGILGGSTQILKVDKDLYDKFKADSILTPLLSLLYSITGGKVKDEYILTVYGEVFHLTLDSDSLNVKSGLVYSVMWKNTNIHPVVDRKVIVRSITSSTNMEEVLTESVQSFLQVKGLIPPPKATYYLADITLTADFQSFAGDSYIFDVSASNFYSATIPMKINKYSSDNLGLELEQNIDKFVKAARTEYNLFVNGVQCKATLVKGSSQTGYNRIITYHIYGTIQGQGDIDMLVDLKSATEIGKALETTLENHLDKLRKKGENTVSGDVASKLGRVASPRKEVILNQIGKYLKVNYFGNESVVITTDIILNISPGISEIKATITDTYGYDKETMTLMEYYTDFKNRIVGILDKHGVTYSLSSNSGIDDSGDAYITISIKDKNLISEIIQKHNLDEFFNLKSQRLSILVESQKRKYKIK
jgi:hypothetical protein